MTIDPYLFFDGRAEEAMTFYAAALDARIETMMRFAECPDPVPPEHMPPGGPQKIMHASLLVRDRRLMCSDGCMADGGGFRGFSLALQYDDEADARRAFDRLADGGTIVMPMGPTFFSPCYGILDDRFGVQWMVMADTSPSA